MGGHWSLVELRQQPNLLAALLQAASAVGGEATQRVDLDDAVALLRNRLKDAFPSHDQADALIRKALA
jgi:hypothetical protein